MEADSVYFQVQLYLKSGTFFDIRFFQVPKVPEKIIKIEQMVFQKKSNVLKLQTNHKTINLFKKM